MNIVKSLEFAKMSMSHNHCASAFCHAEWRSGVAGHLILSDEDLTSVVQGSWKRLNTLQHYKVRVITECFTKLFHSLG